jgi:hypothetical protein
VRNLVLDDLKSLQVSVLGQTRCSKPEERLGHEYTSACNIVAWGTLSSIFTLRSNFQCTGHMANRNLIRGLLNFDILERYKLGRPDLHGQFSLDFIDFTFVARTLDQWVELLLADDLVNFESTNIAHVNRHLHLGFHVGCSHHDTLDRDEGSNLLSLNFSHLADFLL